MPKKYLDSDGLAKVWDKAKNTFAKPSDIPDISGKLDKTGGEMTGTLAMKGTDFELKTSGSSSNDSGDIIFRYGNGNEKARIWSDNTYTASSGRLNYRVYNENGLELMSSTIPSLSDIPSGTMLWNNGSTTWVVGNNITCSADSGEFSFDVTDNSSGNSDNVYWHVWSGNLGNSMIQCYPKSGTVNIPYTLTVAGNAVATQTWTQTYYLPLTGGTISGRIYGNTGNGLEVQSSNTGSWKEGITIYQASNNYGVLAISNSDRSYITALVSNSSTEQSYIERRYNGTNYVMNIPLKNGTVAMTSDIPTVNNPTITFTQGGTTKGTITLNQSSNQTIALDGGSSGATLTLLWSGTTTSSITGLDTSYSLYLVSTYFGVYVVKQGRDTYITAKSYLVTGEVDFQCLQLSLSSSGTLSWSGRRVEIYSNNVANYDGTINGIYAVYGIK